MDSTTPQLILCRFKLPLAYNDGQPVEEERREAFLDRIYVEFGGLNDEGVERGMYRRADTGEKQVEWMRKVSVGVPGEEGVAKLRQMVAEIGGELDQECMYFEVAAASVVELVPSTKKGDR